MKASKDFFSKIRVDGGGEVPKSTQCSKHPCMLCERGTPPSLVASSSWSVAAQVVLYCLHHMCADSKFFNLKTDIYPYVEDHYELLRCTIAGAAESQWRKCLQDAHSHNKDLFESGTREKGKGWWSLVEKVDPWVEDPLDSQRKIVYKIYHPEPPTHGQERKRLQDRLLRPANKRPRPNASSSPERDDGVTNNENGSNEKAAAEAEVIDIRIDMFSRIQELKDEVGKFKEEFTLKRQQNIMRIQQLDELIRKVTPSIIDHVQSLEQEIISQQTNQEGKIQVAKTALAAEGLFQIKHQWQEMKDMRHSITFITSQQ